MKKIVYALVLLLGVAVAGCKKDSPKPTPTPTGLAQQILGIWDFDKQEDISNNQTSTTFYTKYNSEFKEVPTLISKVWYADDPGLPETEHIINSYYSIVNESLITIGGGDRHIIKIDEHNLVFYGEATINGVYHKVISYYTK